MDLVPPGLEISSSNAPTSLDHQDLTKKEKILMVPLRTSQGWVWPPTGWKGRVLHAWGQRGGTPDGHLHRVPTAWSLGAFSHPASSAFHTSDLGRTVRASRPEGWPPKPHSHRGAWQDFHQPQRVQDGATEKYY